MVTVQISDIVILLMLCTVALSPQCSRLIGLYAVCSKNPNEFVKAVLECRYRYIDLRCLLRHDTWNSAGQPNSGMLDHLKYSIRYTP
jgi:hypothetical protein